MILSVKSLLFLIFISCCYSIPGTMAITVSEAEQIALEYSGELLAPPDLVSRIDKDLKAIRSQYSQVANVGHTPKWEPGKLIISSVTKESLETINKSKYGPIETREIFQDTIYLVTFTKPYHPETLAKLLQKELGISGGEPDSVTGGSSSITLSCDQSGKNTYVFYMGSGDCPSGCINRRYITFTVGPEENSVQLVSDTGNNDSNEPTTSRDEPLGVGMFGLQ